SQNSILQNGRKLGGLENFQYFADWKSAIQPQVSGHGGVRTMFHTLNTGLGYWLGGVIDLRLKRFWVWHFPGMNTGKYVLSQLLDLIHPQTFYRCVSRYGGNYKVSMFSCWNQFVCMAFAQLTWRESLRDIEACLNSRSEHLYHLGLRGPVHRSTLADA